jgi:DNA-binding MarR family transcriptional regulator
MSISVHEFADKMNEVIPVMIKEFSRRHASEIYKGKITLPQFLILNFLHGNEDSKMSDLAHFMFVSTAAMTGMVERLVKCGYVAREYEPKDRRIIKIKLTSKGSELAGKINRERRRIIIDVFGKVSEADRANYSRVLMKIKEILTKDRK